jgi:membrane protease YdiL (CAAX protease family)
MALGVIFIGLLGVHIAYALAHARKEPPGPRPVPPLTTLVMLVAPFIVVCSSGVKRARFPMRIGAFLQTALFVLACGLGVRQEVFTRDLISPVHIGFGLLAGHLAFGLSLLITQRSARDAAGHFLDFGSLWAFAVDSPSVLMQFISVGVAEEMIYRVGAQPLLIQWTGSAVAGILVVALCFACVHEHFFKNAAPQSVEFFGFSILLGILYYWTSSPILVIVIHAVRNIEIAYLEYLIRVEERGGEEAAARETEFLTGERLFVMLVLPVRDVVIACLEYVAGADRRTEAQAGAAGLDPARTRRSAEQS